MIDVIAIYHCYMLESYEVVLILQSPFQEPRDFPKKITPFDDQKTVIPQITTSKNLIQIPKIPILAENLITNLKTDLSS